MWGDTLRVIAGDASLRVHARFHPANRHSHRGTRLDFAGRRARERPDAFGYSLAESLRR